MRFAPAESPVAIIFSPKIKKKILMDYKRIKVRRL